MTMPILSENTTTQLSKSESQQLSKLESVITKGMKTFVEVGNALKEIRDSRLYR